VTVPARRELVRYALSRQLSVRQALRLACPNSSGLRYEHKDDGNGRLRERIAALAHRRRRHGYRTIYLRLTQEDWVANLTQVRRLYRKQNLMVKRASERRSDLESSNRWHARRGP
jgi:putative transposase